ncbi:MAG: HD domain-containing protein [Eubacterium sp.]|nr:HD domain-containing protein [Eubacterium sp.]
MLEEKQSSKFVWVLGLILGSIGLNILGSQIAAWTGIVLYLDSIGTVVSSALGGYIPGIIVGFLTNMLKTISDTPSIYYGVINVLIAVFSAFFVRRGFFRNPLRLLAPIFATGILVGSLSSILTWFLYGFATEGITADLASYVHTHTFLGLFPSQITADVTVDLADKLVTFLIAFGIFHLIPKQFKSNFHLTNWQQEPLSKEMLGSARKTSIRRMSLRTKILMVLIPSMLVIAAAATLISYEIYKHNNEEDYEQLASTVANLAADMIDPGRVDDYLELGAKADGYNAVKRSLLSLRESSDKIAYVYVLRVLEDGCHVVFDVDTNPNTSWDPGDIIQLDDAYDPYIPDMLEGHPIEPIITEDEYGWLMVVYKPVYNDAGRCVCYACVDVSMEALRSSGYTFLAKLFSLFFGLFIMILAIGLWLTEYHIILPTNSISYRVSHFAHDNKEAMGDHVRAIHELDIVTGDEVENLYHAVSKMADDDYQYMLDIQKKNDMIMQMQSGLIMILADIVESRDKCTGDHVRKTAEYTKIIMTSMKELDICTDQLTDEFMNNVYNSAPLHDVGKIHVSDAILNKNGKLTDEEFAIMKEHTTVGAQILDRAIELVPDTSGYLHEAKNLALYHHEKWNGSGYPMGIAGEDIPLSARIMAVADVFDALVSVRSYKKGMPFEKAMGIITEGSGSHFDPEVVRAFESAEDEVRRVSEMHMEQVEFKL